MDMPFNCRRAIMKRSSTCFEPARRLLRPRRAPIVFGSSKGSILPIKLALFDEIFAMFSDRR